MAEIDRWKVPLRRLGMSDIANEMNMGCGRRASLGRLSSQQKLVQAYNHVQSGETKTGRRYPTRI